MIGSAISMKIPSDREEWINNIHGREFIMEEISKINELAIILKDWISNIQKSFVRLVMRQISRISESAILTVVRLLMVEVFI